MSESVYGFHADSIADEFNIPRPYFRSLITQESSWRADVPGSSGELGLTQLMPKIAEKYGVSDRTNPVENMRGGAAFLSDLFKKYGNWRDALSHYNAGFNLKAGRSYADSVLGRAGTQLTPEQLAQEVQNAPLAFGMPSLFGNATKSVFDKTDTGFKEIILTAGLWIIAIFFLFLGFTKLIGGVL